MHHAFARESKLSLSLFFFNQIGITGLRLRRFFHLLIERLFANIVFVMSIVPCAIGFDSRTRTKCIYLNEILPNLVKIFDFFRLDTFLK